MSGDFWAYSESEQHLGEAGSAAAEVARSVSSRSVAVELGRRGTLPSGTDSELLVTPTAWSSSEVAAEALARAWRSRSPAALVLAGTREGRETAARLAAKLGIGCITDASRLTTDGESLYGERGAFAGKVNATVRTPLPCVATIKVGSYPRPSSHAKESQSLDVGAVGGRVKQLEVRKKEPSGVDLKTARVIVSAGRGVKRKEDLKMIEDLAKQMGGALGCSRPLSSDLGWLPEEHHIGLTGVTVKPELYVAVGISGQLQHVAGMKDSKTVVAINTDKDAPIFQVADYGIVGDLYQVVPALQRALAAKARL